MRLFFALDINSNDKQSIACWQNSLNDQSLALVSADNLHITLSFLGQISSAQQHQLTSFVDQQLMPVDVASKQRLTINHLSLFNKPKVLYLGLADTPHWLLILAEKLKQQALSLGIFQESRTYCPHITVARKAKVLPNVAPLTLTLTVNSFSLYQSLSTPTGVIYQPIKTWPLVI